VVAAGCRASLDPAATASVEAALRPQDRLLFFDEPHDIALCARAAHEARGEALFFTESHCYPDPDALLRADETLRARPEWAGFSGRSVPVTHNRLSRAEAAMYDADIRQAMEEHPWRKVLDQVFVVRKDSYHDAGGFRAELGHFAEWHLAAALHHRGHRIGYAPEVRIRHYYVGDLPELIEFTTDFARGEMLLHATADEDPCRSYFEAPPQWRDRGGGPALARLRVYSAVLQRYVAWCGLQACLLARASVPLCRAALRVLLGATIRLERARFLRDRPYRLEAPRTMASSGRPGSASRQ
jgi:hypothetical protein